MTDATPEIQKNALLDLLEQHTARRTFLKSVLVAGAGVAGAGSLARSAFAQAAAADTPATILSIAATAEQLAVTFYSNGIANATALGIAGQDLDDLKAAVIEEQIHHDFFVANGGKPLTGTFSFPQGAKTFTDLQTFIATQQQLEGAFDSAFIAASFEFAQMNMPDLARIAVMVAMIESEHRALGRRIAGLDPAPNWAFAPQLVPTVGAAVGVLMSAGYLSPVAGNTYTYAPVDFTSATFAPAHANVMYKAPFVAGSTPTAVTGVYGANTASHGLPRGAERAL